MSWGLIASAVVGGAAAGVVAGLVGGMASRPHQDRQWLRDRQSGSYLAVLEAYARIEQELRVAHLHGRPPATDWTPWDSAVLALTLVAPQAVIDAAADLADACVTVAQRLPGPSGTDNRWSPHAETLRAAQSTFVNAARQTLERSQPLLRPYAGAHRAIPRNPNPGRDSHFAPSATRRPTPTAGRPPAALPANAAAPAAG
jgi:hypothetical protein